MDPETAWNEMCVAFDESRWNDAIPAARNLLNWMEKGGFPPHVLPVGKLQTQRLVAETVCRTLIRTARDHLRTVRTDRD